MAVSKKQEDTEDTTTQPEAKAPKVSKARQKFLDGELSWREYLEQENAGK